MRIAQKSSLKKGFTLIEIMVVVGIVGLLGTIAVCNIFVARDSSRLQIIRQNLGKIESAKQEWAIETGQREGAAVADVSALADYLRGGTVKQVVQETYVPNPIGIIAEATLPSGVSLGPYAAGASIPAP